MTLRHAVTLSLAVLALGACKKKTPPEAPVPDATGDAAVVDPDRVRADSLAAVAAAEERARAAAAAEAARIRADLTETIFFEYDSERLTPTAEEKLRAKAAILREHPALRLRVEGHADERGSTEYNLALAMRRAEMVRGFLSGYGVAPERLPTTTYGEERPLVEGSGEEAWARNRRAEFVIAAGDVFPGRGR